MPFEKYVWYACYGSNLLKERFLLYIQGGSLNIKGIQKIYKGCNDKSLPIDDRPFIMHHALYFAGHSSTWCNCGVAFVDTREEYSVITYARIYLITREQFDCIKHQEGSKDIWYGNELKLGTIDQIPVYTLTRTDQYNRYDMNCPDEEYLDIIYSGMAEIHPNVNAKQYVMKHIIDCNDSSTSIL